MNVREACRAYRAMYEASIAQILDHFPLDFDAVAKLTDRQIKRILYHKRTKHGAIAVPEPVVPDDAVRPTGGNTLESALRDLDLAAGALGMRPEDVASARHALMEKFGGKPAGGPAHVR